VLSHPKSSLDASAGQVEKEQVTNKISLTQISQASILPMVFESIIASRGFSMARAVRIDICSFGLGRGDTFWLRICQAVCKESILQAFRKRYTR
jgi:hypothetical protein